MSDVTPGVEGSDDPRLIEVVRDAAPGRDGASRMDREDAICVIAAIRSWDAVEARVAKGGCPVERRDCDGPGSYYCDEVLWHSACRRYFEQRREATR